MKNLLLLALLVPFLSSAQQTELVKDKATGEIYTVLKSDKQMKHGNYSKTTKKLVVVNGHYSNGVRDSIWNFFDKDGLVQSVDFTAKRLISRKPMNDEMLEFRVYEDDSEVIAKVDSPPVHIWGRDFVKDFIVNNFKPARLRTCPLRDRS